MTLMSLEIKSNKDEMAKFFAESQENPSKSWRTVREGRDTNEITDLEREKKIF